MNFSVKPLLPHVYHIHFDSGYDLAMHFVRVQEFYESPRYFRQLFTLVEFMEWYAKKYGRGAFTYPTDWLGFNTPSTVLLEVYGDDTLLKIPDFNHYDELMLTLVQWAKRLEGDAPFYFIGTSSATDEDDPDDANVLDHEIAHALRFTNQSYCEQVNLCLSNMDTGVRKKAEQVLDKMGYHATTIQDEIHAYSATGLCSGLKEVISKRDAKPFQKVFQSFRK